MANNQPKIKPAKAATPQEPKASPSIPNPTGTTPNQAENTFTPPTPEVPKVPENSSTPQAPIMEPGTMPPGETSQIPGTPMDQGTMQDQNWGNQPDPNSREQLTMEEQSEEYISEVEQETEEETQRAERIREKARKQLENLQKESEANVDSGEVTERRPAVAE